MIKESNQEYVCANISFLKTDLIAFDAIASRNAMSRSQLMRKAMRTEIEFQNNQVKT